MMTDQALMRRLAKNDESAAVEFAHRFRSLCYAYAAQLRMRDADDFWQQVLIRCWRGARTYRRGKSKLITWTNTVIRNTAVDSLRRERNKIKGVSIDELRGLEPGYTDAPGPDSAPPHSETMHLLARGLTFEQVGRALRKPVGTLKSRAWHERQKARGEG